MPKKRPPINYIARTFDSIRSSLIDYAKRYYPDTFKDFNDASFGMHMLENTAYIGDILSFYLDYSVNEGFLDSALEYNNVVRKSRELGFKFLNNQSSYGILSLYVIVPATSVGLGPNPALIPTVRRGSEFSTIGGNIFTLTEDVDFSDSKNEVVVARVNETTGVPTSYAIKSFGEVVSGRVERTLIDVGSFERFKKIEIGGNTITEILSVIDDEGHEYVEVEHLSQDVIYKSVLNRNGDREYAPNIIKPIPVPRRFVTARERDKISLQFGYGSDSELVSVSVADPSSVVLNLHGRDFISDTSFDPTKILDTDKFGIAPSNTTLTISYRVNDSESVNASVGSITDVTTPIFKFDNLASLTKSDIDIIVNSLEVTNESKVVGDVTIPTSEELRIRAKNYFATQNRCVTREDYRSLCYAMPPNFGAIKRINVVQDSNSFKRNLNLYVISEDNNFKLTAANSTIKENLKVWINSHKMVNDTIDILDAKIINFGIEFLITAETDRNRFDVLQAAIAALRDEMRIHMDVGEPIQISRIYNVLNETNGVEDTVDVRIIRKTGTNYATTRFLPDDFITADGRLIRGFDNIIYELKYPNDDIVGSVL
jgi:hypothetical protein